MTISRQIALISARICCQARRASSTRGRYWRQAGRVFSDLPVTGTGAGTFGIARLHYRKDQLVAQHAHGFIAQTASDLGTLGLIVILAFAGAWFISAARTTDHGCDVLSVFSSLRTPSRRSPDRCSTRPTPRRARAWSRASRSSRR